MYDVYQEYLTTVPYFCQLYPVNFIHYAGTAWGNWVKQTARTPGSILAVGADIFSRQGVKLVRYRKIGFCQYAFHR